MFWLQVWEVVAMLLDAYVIKMSDDEVGLILAKISRKWQEKSSNPTPMPIKPSLQNISTNTSWFVVGIVLRGNLSLFVASTTSSSCW